jgi:hypothetical protein
MSASSSTPIHTQFWAVRRRAIRLAKSDDRDDHGPEHSVTPARVGRVVALVLTHNGHWAMASASGGQRSRGG